MTYWSVRRLVRAASALLLVAGGALAGFAGLAVPSEEHCVVNVVGQEPDGEFILSDARCYDSLSEAMADAAGGYRSLVGADSPALVSGGVMSSTFTLGRHYDGIDGTGSSISVVGSSCTGGWWNTSSSWDNRISSSWNGCFRLKHHDLPARGGIYESTTGVGTTDNLSGYLNNKAESVSYWSS